MALTQISKVRFAPLQTTLQDSVADWTARFEPVVFHRDVLENGTGTGQADLAYSAERTVASGTNDDIDLQGSITDIFGSSFLAARLIALFIHNQQEDGSANTTDLALTYFTGGTGSPAYLNGGTARSITVGPGGLIMLYSPGANGLATVQATTEDIIRVANSAGASNSYRFYAAIRSA